MDAVQQLEVALLGLPASGIIDILASRLEPPTILSTSTVQPPHVYTATQMAPPPRSIPVVGLTGSPSTLTLSICKTKEPLTKHHHMIPTLFPPSTKSSPLPAAPLTPGPSVEPFQMVVIPNYIHPYTP